MAVWQAPKGPPGSRAQRSPYGAGEITACAHSGGGGTLGRRTCTATLALLPNIICKRPMSHLEPSDTKISAGVMPVLL